MKDGSTYPRNTALAILIGGDPGTGKTVASFSMPDPGIIDGEGNLKSGIERNPGKKFYWDTPDRKANGDLTKPEEWWPRMEEIIRELGPKPEVKSLVFDGLGRAATALKEWLVYEASRTGEKMPVIAGSKQMAQNTWSEYERKLTQLVWLLRSFNKPVLMTCHLKVDENELTAIKEQKVDIQGKLVGSFPKLFTDFFQTMAVPNSDARYAKSNGVRYFIRTAPTIRLALKCSCGLPAEFELGDKCWTDVMNSILPPTGAPPATGG